MKSHIILFALIILFNSNFAQINSIDSMEIWEDPPDSISKIFLKGIISIADRYEYGLAISPDYDEIFYTEEPAGLMVIKRLENGNWSTPVVANLRGNNSLEFEAFYSPDGKKLFFSSEVNDTSRLWISIKKDNCWSKPKLLISVIKNTPVLGATLSVDNTIYYTNLAAFRIYKSTLIKNEYSHTEDIGLPFGVHPFVSKDGSYILFNGKGDIYVTFKDEDKKWLTPIKLNASINSTEYDETCPTLSPDDKYIFFSRYNDLNEKCDIYWVNTNSIEEARKELIK